MEPTLIIGLGGIGGRITASVYKRFLAGNPSEVERCSLVCQCIDSDAVDNNTLREQLPAGWVVDIPGYEHEPSREEVCASFLHAGREGNLSSIDQAIERLAAIRPRPLQVHIICSLAGYTGSGIFIQTAQYVNNVLHDLGIEGQRIIGYFILGDVFFRKMPVDKNRKEAFQANTSASLDSIGQSPFDLCYLMGYNYHYSSVERHCEALGEFLFFTVVSDEGNYFRNAINNTLQRIERYPTEKFAAIGVSKLVYPVDDLFAYFAHQRVADQLATWCQVDKDIQARFDEYKKNEQYGIHDKQPDKGEEFIRSLENYKDGSGIFAVQFRQIYNSTQVLDEDMIPVSSKASAYIEAVKEFVEKTVEKSKDLEELYSDATQPLFTTKDETNDIHYVARRERELDDYKRAVMSFIDGSKQYAIRECLFVDHDAEDYVSKTPEAHRHRLNSIILEPGNEMHPLAARYFLYDVKRNIKGILEGREGEKEANKKLKKQIEEEYKESFDIPETKQKKESAQDKLKAASQKNSGLSKMVGWITGKNPYKEAKEDYLSKSSQQAEAIHEYATSKLLEEVYAGLLDQVNGLIEESETFFENLPAAIQSIDNERVALLKKHNVENADPSVEYVLASEEHKRDIYDFVISRNDSPFFPSKMSASVYRTMFHNVYNQLNKDKKIRKAEAIEANKNIVRDCIAYQDEIIRESNQRYAVMNVLDALKEEALWENDNNIFKVKDYMKERFRLFRDRAKIVGPKYVDSEARYINAWYSHPDCLGMATMSQAETDELLGDTFDIGNPYSFAFRQLSESFRRNEIVRINAVYLLRQDLWSLKKELE